MCFSYYLLRLVLYSGIVILVPFIPLPTSTPRHVAVSEGNSSGNQPNCPKSTLNSPSAFTLTSTPSTLNASAWFRAPFGWELLMFSFYFYLFSSSSHSMGRRIEGYEREQTYRGEMTPFAFMTLCQGTFPLLNRASGSAGRCFRQRPTCLGRWAVARLSSAEQKQGNDSRVPISAATCP